MLWIVGADSLGSALRHLQGGGPAVRFVGEQLEHAAWAGFRFFDLIYPLFVFMMGVAVTFSIGRLVEIEGRDAALLRICRRALLLFLLGIFYYGGLSTPFEQIRLMGVLQRLAICYFCTSLLFVYLKPRGLVVAWVGLLLGYWALLTFVPVPGSGAGDYREGYNLANWIDRVALPWRKLNGDHDPEGLLSHLPAVASCLLGVFAGLWLRTPANSDRRKVAGLAAAGALLLVAGWVWGLQFPVIKKIWTSSFVLVAGGWSMLLLAVFYLVVDVVKLRAWAAPFVWVGTNALTIYLLGNIISFSRLARRLGGGEVAGWFDTHWPGAGNLWLALIGTGVSVLICRFLYQRKIFLRL